MPATLGRRAFLHWTGAGLLPWAGSAQGQPHVGRIMRYARLGRTGLRISDISFGSSRLRHGDEDLVRAAMDRGVNYFDTADGYGGGQSEIVLGKVLKGRRDRVHIASKTKARTTDTADVFMEALDASLRRLQTDYLDIYFNHAVNDIARLRNSEWHEFTERARQLGKIRFTGISGHGGHLAECLEYAVDHDAVDVMLVAFNFGQDPAFYEGITRSWDLIATQPELPALLQRAREKDVGVIAMKTLMGARLNDMRPFETDGGTFAQAAFRWTLTRPFVDALVISMTSEPRIDEYLAASGAAQVSRNDLQLLHRYAALNGATHCRQACNDCAGRCPYGVPIADVLRTRMYAADYGDVDFARREYAQLERNAAACITCSGDPCRDACTHGLAISDLCAPTHRMLA